MRQQSLFQLSSVALQVVRNFAAAFHNKCADMQSSSSLVLHREEEDSGYPQVRTQRRKHPGETAGRSLLRQHTVSGTWQDTNREPAKE